MAFDREVVDSEYLALPQADAANLGKLIKLLEASPTRTSKPVLVEDYGQGIRCLRDVNAQYQGRCLFFVAEARPGYQRLVVVAFYKKEADRVPKRILDKALKRKAAWERKKKK